MQTNTTYYRGIWHTIHTICRDEGYWGLYKGLGATLLVSFPLCFCAYLALPFFDSSLWSLDNLCDAGGWTQYSNKLFCLRVIEVLLAFSKVRTP